MKRPFWRAAFTGLFCLAVVLLIVGLAYWAGTRSAPTGPGRESSDEAVDRATGATTDTVGESAADLEPLLSIQGWPALYVNIVSHNEDTFGSKAVNYQEEPNRYRIERDGVAAFAKMIADHGAKYNFQTDWNFLLGLKKEDQGAANTNGKNLLRYLVEDLGMSVDPHSHEHAGYNYADVAYLISQLGVEPSRVVGGLIASPAEDSKLEYLWRLNHGSTYPLYRWQPEILWGGGTSLHMNEEDLWISGVWRPKDNEHYDVDDPAAPLPVVGHYDSGWEGLDKLLALQSAGKLTAGKIYTVAIMNTQSSFTDAYIADFADRLDSYADQTADGRIVWTTIQETYDDWVKRYDSEPNIFHWEE